MSQLQPRPVLGDPKPYTFPEHTRLAVGGGEIVAIDVPGQKYASIRLVQPFGGLSDPADRKGVAMLTAESLEDGVQGDNSLAPALERHGADWICYATWDSFVTGVDAPTTRIGDATALFAEAVRGPALRDEDVLRRREQLLEGFWLEASRPSRLAMRAIGSQLFSGRYATPISGAPVALQGVEPEMVREFHAGTVAASAGTLVVVGDLSGVDLEGLGRTVFGGAAPVAFPEPVAPAPAPGELPRVLLLDRPGSVQSALILAQRSPSRAQIDLPRAEGMSEVLGGMFTSRLNQKLREELGYTYGVGSRFDLRRDSGVFLISTQVDTPTTAPSLTATLEEIRRFKADGATGSELAAVRQANTVGLPVTYSNARSLAHALVEMVVHDLPADHVDRLRAGYEALTAEDLRSAAEDYLDPAEMAVIVVGDAASLKAPLGEAGFGEVDVREPENLWN
ncbi:M16 family metallopeptidase [Nocardiopsis composta]|uniref:Putative Zn-dependent peptidase n=1 Tax=Nocardiopsis composta TaxID=157465 RepID=A0A7W8QQT6_9ACTN|nr:pitrilysin family protein [Nocardiopsis composta]MBB5434887.1 putative Zn-dependent peptidase [Nocardiopsis composta]